MRFDRIKTYLFEIQIIKYRIFFNYFSVDGKQIAEYNTCLKVDLDKYRIGA